MRRAVQLERPEQSVGCTGVRTPARRRYTVERRKTEAEERSVSDPSKAGLGWRIVSGAKQVPEGSVK